MSGSTFMLLLYIRQMLIFSFVHVVLPLASVFMFFPAGAVAGAIIKIVLITHKFSGRQNFSAGNPGEKYLVLFIVESFSHSDAVKPCSSAPALTAAAVVTFSPLIDTHNHMIPFSTRSNTAYYSTCLSMLDA